MSVVPISLGLFKLNVCVCVTVKVKHCVNRNENIDAENGFRPIFCICDCVTIDAMLNCDVDVDTNTRPQGEHDIKGHRRPLWISNKLNINTVIFSLSANPRV